MKRIAQLILVMVVAMLASCWQENPQGTKPDGLVPKQELMDLMVDLYLAESANNMRMLEKDTTLPKYAEFFKAVLEKHNVTAQDYENSLKYYAENPDEINAIYDEVLQRLTKMESEAGGDVEQHEE